MNLFTELVNAGAENLPFENRSDIILVNRVSLAGAIICLLLSLIAIPFAAIYYIILNVFTILLLMTVIILNHLRRAHLARILFIGVLPLTMVGYAYFFGSIAAENYLIVGAILGVYLLRKSPLSYNLVFLICSLGFIASKVILILVHQDIKMEGMQNYIFITNTLMSFGLIYYVTYVFKNLNEQQRSAITKVSQARGKLLSVLSHDLKSPIDSLQLMSEHYSNPDFSIAEKDMIMKELSGKLNDTSHLLDNMLIWMKKQMDGIKPHYASIDLVEIIERNITLVSKEAEAKNLSIVRHFDEKVTAFSDYEMVNLIIRNLLSNAIKFSTNGQVTVSISTKGNHHLIIIEDQGVGMDKAQLSRLFKEQQTESGTGNESGFGVGLLLVQDFLDILGEKIEVQSQLGSGTIMKFGLPKEKR